MRFELYEYLVSSTHRLTLQMPTYASMQIDTRSVEEKFATLKDDVEEEDDKLSEPAQFSDAEDLGEIVTVGEGED